MVLDSSGDGETWGRGGWEFMVTAFPEVGRTGTVVMGGTQSFVPSRFCFDSCVHSCNMEQTREGRYHDEE